MILADSHLHSEFSSDSSEPVVNQIEAAIRKGMKVFYLTDHHDIDFPPEIADGLTFQLDTPTYLKRLHELKEEYRNQIEVRFGVELGLMEHITDKLYAYTQNYDFDFIIGSSHLVRGMDPYYPSYYEGREQREAYREYFETELACVKAFDDYDVYGHIDYVVRYGPDRNYPWVFSYYEDIIEELLKELIRKDKGIEINTSSLYKGLGYAHPHVDILTLYKDLGGEILTIGSDAHESKYFAYGFSQIEDMLVSKGFRCYHLFKNRKPQEMPLG